VIRVFDRTKQPNQCHEWLRSQVMNDWNIANCSVWGEIDRREKDSLLTHRYLTQICKVSQTRECRLIKLGQMGKNHYSSSSGNHCLLISGS
jgi:hypothetical protein